jgi:hypothetical protein
MLAAWELGIGSCHASVYDEPLARELLGYPRACAATCSSRWAIPGIQRSSNARRGTGGR